MYQHLIYIDYCVSNLSRINFNEIVMNIFKLLTISIQLEKKFIPINLIVSIDLNLALIKFIYYTHNLI